MKETRQQEYVDARIIYSRILRDRGYTLKSIGDSIKKDHTVIVHYMKSSDFLMFSDKKFASDYIACKDIFTSENPEPTPMPNKELERFNDKLIREREKLQQFYEKYIRFEGVLRVLDYRVRVGDEKRMSIKIIRALNE